MKKFLFTFIVTAVLTFGLAAQTKGPDLTDFTPLGADQTTAYGVDLKHVERNGKVVKFTAIAIAVGHDTEGRIVSLDPNNYVFVTVEGDCSSFHYSLLSRWGVIGGRTLPRESVTDVKDQPVEEDTPEYDALHKACLQAGLTA